MCLLLWHQIPFECNKALPIHVALEFSLFYSLTRGGKYCSLVKSTGTKEENNNVFDMYQNALV